MSGKTSKPVPFVKHHKDGSIWARGQTVDDVPVGYWEWSREAGATQEPGAASRGR